METLNRCRLCLQLTSHNYESSKGTVKEMLNFVVPGIDLSLSNDPKICTKCLEGLRVCYEFKISCNNTENAVGHFKELQSSTSAEQNFGHQELFNITAEEAGQTHTKCSLCHMEFKVLNELETEERSTLWKILMEKYFNDMNSANFCTVCEKCLERVFNFFNTSLDIEEQIKSYCNVKGSGSQSLVALNDVYSFMQLGRPATENDSVEDNMMVQTESASINSIYEPTTNFEPLFETVMENYQNIFMPVEDSNTKQEQGSERNSDEGPVYRCNFCPYQSKCKRYFKIHIIKHMDPSEVRMYKCELCSYEARFKFYVTRHMLTHKDPSEIKMYRCEVCHHKTRLKGNLSKHMRTHRSLENTNTFKDYSNCDLETNNESTTPKQRQRQKKCEECDFETFNLTAFRAHVLRHKDPSMQLFDCSSCSYQGKSEVLLKKHMMLHKDPSEIKMYKCDKCYYETRHKHHMDSHVLIHKDPSEVEMYKCDACSYESRHKRALKRHQQIHNKQ